MLTTAGAVLAGSVGAGLLRRNVRADCPPPPGDDPWPGSSFHPVCDSYGGPKKILEIFLYGGLSPWESFFVDPSTREDRELGDAFTETMIAPACDVASALATRRFQTGMEWSVATRPLWADTDIARALRARTRVVAMTHGEQLFEVHPLAIPLALTGRRLGDARAASIGSAIRHKYPGTHSAYVLMPSVSLIDRDAFDAWFSTGLHGCSPPVLIPMGGGAPAIASWAMRTGVTVDSDALVQHYADQYQSGLAGSRARSFEAYRRTLLELPQSPELSSVFGSPLRTGGAAGVPHCTAGGAPSTGPGTTRASLDMAAWLFHEKGARYVGMIDLGIARDTGTGYDGHNQAAIVTFGNLHALLTELTRVMTTGPSSASQIALNDTMIVLNTEYGRTPDAQDITRPRGRNHYARGYVTALIGGPIRPTSDGRAKLVGSLDMMGDGVTGTFRPSQFSSVVLAAAGIDPGGLPSSTVHENFAFGEVAPNFRQFFDA